MLSLTGGLSMKGKGLMDVRSWLLNFKESGSHAMAHAIF